MKIQRIFLIDFIRTRTQKSNNVKVDSNDNSIQSIKSICLIYIRNIFNLRN